MNNALDTTFKLPQGVEDTQSYLSGVDKTAQQYGCVVIQDQARDWEYVVNAKGIFTVRDLMGMGIGIAMIKEMYDLEAADPVGADPVAAAEE